MILILSSLNDEMKLELVIKFLVGVNEDHI